MFKPSGSLFYKDSWDQQYRVTWETVDGLIDITTIIMQPRVWGRQEEGYVKNKVVYRKGVISVIRQVIKLIDNGYEIIAEGASQYTDFIQCNFPCVDGPKDTFLHHLDSSISDETDIRITSGTHWTDPSDLGDSVVFTDLDAGGVSLPGTEEVLEWVDVWA